MFEGRDFGPLLGTVFEDTVIKQMFETKKQFRFYKEIVGDQFEFTEEIFKKMFTIARSRCCQISNDGSPSNTIVPLADYINYDLVHNCVGKFD